MGDSAHIVTREGELRAYALCQCHACGHVSECTPSNDFYSEVPGYPADVLICESCVFLVAMKPVASA